MRPGLYLVHKPPGVTSFSVVRAAKEELAARTRPRKLPLCHGGTLDPFAEGLLLLLAGEATRLMDLLHEAPKRYVAEISWGAETDNGDPLGRVVAEGDPSTLSPELLDGALAPHLGWTEQIPPSTSAKKIGGEPAYRKVHRGEVVELPPSRVYLHEARWRAHALPSSSTLELVCRGGYYVRALARDLGRALGCRAHLRALRRSAIGPWEDPPPGARVGVHGGALLPWYPARSLSREELSAARRGAELGVGSLSPPTWSFPQGFPPPSPRVRAILDDLLVALLRPEGSALALATDLQRGL